MNNAYHPHPTVNHALNYLRINGCPITDEVVLAAQMLWGETQEHEPTAADTLIILAAELLQRAESWCCARVTRRPCAWLFQCWTSCTAAWSRCRR